MKSYVSEEIFMSEICQMHAIFVVTRQKVYDKMIR